MKEKVVACIGIVTLLALCFPMKNVNAQPLAIENVKLVANADTSEKINVGTIELKMEIYDSEFNLINPISSGFKCNSGILKVIKDDSIILNVPINDTVDTLNYTKFNYDISYKKINKILSTSDLSCKINFNNIIINKSSTIDNTVSSINKLAKPNVDLETINEKVNINPLICSFNSDYFVKITIENIISSNNIVDDYSATFSAIKILEEEQKILDLDYKVYSIEDLFIDNDFIEPIKENDIISLNRNNDIENKYLDINCNNISNIYSIDDNGILDYYNNNILVINYDNYSVIYENVILTNTNNTYMQGDIIGCSYGENIKVYIKKDDYYINTNYFYSKFNYSKIKNTIPQYIQTDEKWGSNSYGSSTIGQSGCGPSSFAMALSSLTGTEYTTDILVDYMYDLKNGDWGWFYSPGEGSYHSIFKILGDEFGINVDEQISCSKQNLINTLSDNKLVILSIYSGPIYSGDGHFIVLYGTEEDKFYISDSAGLFNQDTLYSYSDLGNISIGFALSK